MHNKMRKGPWFWYNIMALSKEIWAIMTSSNGTIFRVTGTLWGEFTAHRWLPLAKASDAELWWFFIWVWTNSWANNRNAGDLRHHRAHYDVIVMVVCLLSTGLPTANFHVISHCRRNRYSRYDITMIGIGITHQRTRQLTIIVCFNGCSDICIIWCDS